MTIERDGFASHDPGPGGTIERGGESKRRPGPYIKRRTASHRTGRANDAPPPEPLGLGAERVAIRDTNHQKRGTASNVRIRRPDAGAGRCGLGLGVQRAERADPLRSRSHILIQADAIQRDPVDSNTNQPGAVRGMRLVTAGRGRRGAAGLASVDAESFQTDVGRERQNVISLTVRSPYGTATVRGGITRAEGRSRASTVAGARAMIA